MAATPPPVWHRRRLLGAAAGLAAAGALSACGSNTGRNDGGSGKALTQYFHAYGEAGTQQAIKRYAKDFDKAQVKTQWITGNNFESKLFSALLSSSAPDVFEFHPQIQMVKAKQIIPLDDIIAPVKDDYLDADIASHTIDGKVWGVRMIDDPQFFYYRKSLLEKAGLEPPQTLEELVEAAAKLTTADTKGIFLGNTVGPVLNPMIWSTGATTLDTNNEIAYHTDEVVAGLKTLRSLFTSGHLLKDAPTDWWDPSAFNQDLAAIQWCGMWAMPAILKQHGDDVGIMPFPKTGAAGKPAVTNGGWSMFVSSKAKDKDLAKEYVKWLWIDKTEYQLDWSLAYGFHIPPRKSLAAKAEQLKSGLPAEGVKLFNEHGNFDNPSWTQAMIAALDDVVADSVRSDGDPEAALDKADAKVERELSKLFG